MKKNERLRFSDITRFLDEKSAVKNCPSCNAHDWTLQYSRETESDDTVHAAYVLVTGVPFDGSQDLKPSGPHIHSMPYGRPLLPLVCDNCGYFRIHDYLVVLNWVRDNPSRKEGQDVRQET